MTESSGDETLGQTAAARYANLESERSPVLMRGRDYSALTIPTLLPPEGASDATELYQPYQSLGADGVNNLSSKILNTLFPPGASFFRFVMADDVEAALSKKASAAGATPDDLKAKFEIAFGKIEQAIAKQIGVVGARTVLFECIRHLIVTGNGLLFVTPDLRLKFFPLDRFVISRDLDDNVLEIVVKESVSRAALDPRARAVVQADVPDESAGKQEDNTKSVDVYTHVSRTSSGSWESYQEISGQRIPKSDAKYPAGESAWIPVRWSKVSGSAYGRSRCEEYGADLRSFEALSKAIILFAAAAAKVVFLVDSGGTTDKEQLVRADPGDVLDGNAKDISVMRLEKAQDFQLASAKADELKQRLERAFLMSSAVQRQAERVTAEEIRAMVGELEQSLGGVYTILADELQYPFVYRFWRQMTKARMLPVLPPNAVKPKIVTGVDGLGRASDLQRLDLLLQGAEAIFGPQVVAQWVKAGNYFKLRGVALGIDISGLIKTQDEVDAENQQARAQQMAEKLGPAGIKAMSDQTQTPLAGPIPGQ